MTKRRRARIASTIRWSSELFVIVGVMEIAKELFDAVLARNRFVVQELQLGYALQAKSCTDLPAQEGDRSPERLLGIAAGLPAPQRCVEDARLLDIRADLDAGDRHEADSRVVDFAREQLAELSANLIGDSVWT